MEININRENLDFTWDVSTIGPSVVAYRYNRDSNIDQTIMITQDRDTQRYGYVDLQNGETISDMTNEELAHYLTTEHYRPTSDAQLSITLTN